MLMICDDEKEWAKVPTSKQNKVMQEYVEFTQSIVKSGHFRSGSQTQPVSTKIHLVR
jgi:hypothetical protein